MVIRVQKKDKIMKKTYINPQMDIIEIKTAGMLATSFPLNNTTIDAGQSLAPEFGPGMETPSDILGLPDFVFQ